MSRVMPFSIRNGLPHFVPRVTQTVVWREGEAFGAAALDSFWHSSIQSEQGTDLRLP